MTDPVTASETDLINPTDVTEAPTPDPQKPEPEASPAEKLDAAFAQIFRNPTSVECSPDGKYIVYLQPNAEGALEMWLVESEEGAVPVKVDLPFTPVEDLDPDTGRLIRGPQFSPDSTRVAVTGLHPDGDRTAIWIVHVAESGAEAVALADPGDADAEVTAEHDDAPVDQRELDVAGDDGMNAVPVGGAGNDTEPSESTVETIESADESDPNPEALPDTESSTGEAGKDDPAEQAVDDVALDVADDEGMTLLDTSEEEPEADAAESEPAAVIASAAPTVEMAEPYMLADHAGSDRSPRWSPDGEIIAFVSTIDGRDVIALSTPGEPGGLEMLTWSREDSREPQWSRDGKFLAFLRPLSGGEGYHDIWSFSLEAGELSNLTGEKSPTVRHSIEWVPGRNLIAYVTVENDWLGISVVNADNKAGWVVTRESGDKTEPRFAPDEARLVYLRNEGFTTVLCERSLHSSAAVALDPGEGVASFGRWIAPRRVAYAFSAPQKPIGFMVQENTAKAERTAIQPDLGASTRDMLLVQPQPLEFEVGPEEVFSGLEYRTTGASGKVPGIVYLPEGPLSTRRGSFQMEEQALASTALAVFSPVLHGASGFGVAIENDIREFATTELEITDIDEAARALGKLDTVNPEQIALVGHGYGGAMALVAAGARPGSFAAVVAIDPIVDWSTEIANADVTWRNWITDRFGMPFTHADNYALRTPSTFSAVIDVPLILVQTAQAPEHRIAQMEALKRDLDEMGVSYTEMDAPSESLPATLRRVSQKLVGTFIQGKDHVDVVSELSTDEV